jgi:hypothetical protein
VFAYRTEQNSSPIVAIRYSFSGMQRIHLKIPPYNDAHYTLDIAETGNENISILDPYTRGQNELRQKETKE